MSLSTEQFNTIEKYDEEKRLRYFLTEVITHQALWILADEHGCMMLNTEEEDCVPVWPNEAFATPWATGEWQACKAQAIPLTTWLSRWSPGLSEDDLALVIFPNQDNQGLVFFPDELDEALRKAQQKQQQKKP